MKQITLTDEQYNTLTAELTELTNYHWNDPRIGPFTKFEDCGSKILPILEMNTETTT